MLIKINNLSSTEKEGNGSDSKMEKKETEKKKTYWLESGMESDVAPDEMYLMLQADMLSIKRQERALQCEIEEIKSKFVSLVETCGIESGDFPIAESTKIVNSPSFMCRSSPSLTRVTAMSITDEECLLQQMMQGSVCSSSSDSIYENSDNSVKMIMDNNSNYKSSPQILPPDNTLVSIPSMLVPNIVEPLLSSDISNGSSACTNSSDGYPRSTETSSDNDNQCVPCIDFEEELASRTKYYSDFTIDRQRKINNMSTQESNNEETDSAKSSDNGSTEELFTREVEGCEAGQLPPVRVAPVGGDTSCDSRTNFRTRSRASSRSASGTDSSSIPSPSRRHRRRSHYLSDNHSSSSAGSRKSCPQASSTMIEDFSPLSSQSSGSSKHKSSSIPRASSTMIENIPSSRTSSQCSSAEDLASVYTWSIHDTSDDVCLEESYMRNMGHKIVAKPPIASRASSSSSSGSSKGSRKSSKRDRKSRKIEHVFPVPVLSDSISVIEQASGIHDAYLGADSLYEDENIQYKASTLPRTSTRINLFINNNKSSGSSSMEAKCSSMPDMLSVCTPNDFHSVPNSDEEDDSADDSGDDSSPLQERLDLPGKSSSSGSHVSPPENMSCSVVAPHNTDALIDSILTDSPTSVGSSGIAAPYNSYNSPDSLPASRASQSTASDNKSESSSQNPSAPPSSVVSSPVVSTTKQKLDSIFKIPVNTQPLKKLFKFKRSRGKSAEKVMTSTPNQGYTSSVRSDPLSKRKLFTSSTKKAQEVQLMDKKAVIKKFKKFSESFHKQDRSGLIRIQTLANL